MREKKMGFQLHQVLKSLCFNTQWKYAIFWKLKHRARMVLTWEDAYYNNHDQQCSSEDRSLSETLGILHEGHFLHDPLGLAVAKMSYHVFSLGEGIVGQVAVTGRHRWIISDNQMMDSCLSIECFDGWQAQFSAGIRTIAVVAVVPHGVVQLGSVDKVTENLKLVTHIKEAFLALQDTSVANISDRNHCSSGSSLPLPEMPMQSEKLAVSHDKRQNKEKDKDEKKDGIVKKEELNQRSPLLEHPRKHTNNSQGVLLPVVDQREAIEGQSACKGLQLSQPKCDGRIELVYSQSELVNLDTPKQGQMRLWNHGNCDRETSASQHAGVGSGCQDTSYASNVFENINLCNVILPADSSRIGNQCCPFDALESASYAENCLNCERSHQKPELYGHVHSDVQLREDMNNMDFQTELSCKDALNKSLTFSAGFELLEALGPSFLKQNNYQDWHMEESEVGPTMEMPLGIGCSHLVADSGSEDLLEAVVANVCLRGLDSKSERSFYKSAESLLTSDEIPEPSNGKLASSSAAYSMDQSSFCSVSDIRSPKALSSWSSSMCSERFEKPLERRKMNKKRSRPGENPRPRPRDRQLIQDRIKELRELVPNGSKCSIDSLLERTIKHMLFLQSITRHAEKLNRCAESRLHDKEAGLPGSSSFEQGSSWAMEVGTDLKVHSIVVENLNMNGQMLIEILCEECSHVLEIAEAIRSLGLTILKGITGPSSEKTWIWFVVEGQNNRSMHRMDILWPLVQLLQSKTTV
ncbi:Transcription factor MYC/MYB N-terminal [Dillenia turbinata]|uniref:Transcription factor MYC/MYB N-terminal n=1 Tax=Dillenia turbinata TaxID=194707 RepID=A0AAN8ZNE3_9MAGN